MQKGKLFLGQTDIPLSEEGRFEARAAAEKFSGMGINPERIYTSDLSRTRETAEIIAKELSCPRVVNEAGLREINLGDWDGRLIAEIKAEFPAEYEARGSSMLTYRTPNGESFHDLRRRAAEALKKILSRDQDESVVLVTHLGVIRALLSAIAGETGMLTEAPGGSPLWRVFEAGGAGTSPGGRDFDAWGIELSYASICVLYFITSARSYISLPT
jgi:probable phosphoglycerate mutase